MIDDIEDDDYIPDALADMAAEHGVSEDALRQALRESHEEAGVAEVLFRAREIEDAAQAQATTYPLGLV